MFYPFRRRRNYSSLDKSFESDETSRADSTQKKNENADDFLIRSIENEEIELLLILIISSRYLAKIFEVIRMETYWRRSLPVVKSNTD